MRTPVRPVLAVALTLVLGLAVTAGPAGATDEPAAAAATTAVPTQPEDAAPTTAAPTTPAPTTPEPTTPEPTTPAPTTPTPTTPAPEGGTGPQQVSDAQLRWGLQPQLHRKPYYGKNFLTAGALPDTKGADMPSSRWKQSEGPVSIVRAKDSSYVPATWAGFGTGADHQVVVTGGTGTVDAEAGTATIRWTGRFGVARYSGQTGFTVSDPRIVVTDGRGRLEATLDGYGVSRDGNGSGGASGPLRSTTVVLGQLGAVRLTGKGFTSSPTFYGVDVQHPEQKPDSQGRTGSFPSSFIDFVDQVGQAPFWMTSGSSDDHLKAPSPVTVSFSARDAVAVETPAPVDGTSDPIDNRTRTAPTPPVQRQAALPPPATRSAPVPQPAPVAAPVAQAAFTQPVSASLTGLPGVLVGPDGRSTLGWWLAVTFLLMAAVALALPALVARSRSL
ncbi:MULTISPECIES: hypothetical protein [Aeromicrobium]|uniref:hypothetical protein n=1 Tax=Aeromicrobium TaxID=2040 RepID=UPI0018929B53|nr:MULTISPECIES: hypothetical protein [Aeromicrobium]